MFKPTALLLTIASCVCVQTPQDSNLTSFDTVSIRQNKSADSNTNYGFTPDGFSMTNITLSRLVTFAFRVRSSNFMSGLPSWTDSVRFDIQAKMDEDKLATLKRLPVAEAGEERYLMLQQMLFDRYKFKIHHVEREFPAYALVVGKGGTKLKVADSNQHEDPGKQHGPNSSYSRDGELSLQAVPMRSFAHILSLYLDREVVDQTGLTGKYDFSLKWSPRASSDQSDDAPVDYQGSVFTAIREQLGLSLVSTHPTTADTIVVDNIEMPTEN